MGRKKKRKDNTNIIGIIVLIAAAVIYVKMTFFKDFNPLQNINFNLPFWEKKIEVTERSVKEDYSEILPELNEPEKQEKYVEIFFTKSTGGQDVYVAVQRLKQDWVKVSDVEFAVINLLRGPNKSEKINNIYSEIPSSTKLLSVREMQNRIIINLSSDFEFGGGGDSLYKRMYQLIKTVNKNTTKPIYLYIEGKQANVIGGEGLMLKQPLRGNSLDD
ncbi:MAG: GerMN domain-containing protein [Candidatus Gastranaerophilales bacterium]|nr:GerMN domain-containing protein [Candidatus Gastranaerophilales bacterium]